MGKVCDECVRMIVVGTAGTVIRKIHANSVDDNGYSVLMNAAWNGHEGCLKELLAAGADVNQMTENRYTALMIASKLAHDLCVQLLLQAGADVNVTNKDTGDTALIAITWAADRGGVRDKEATTCVKLLLKAGAKINIKNREGWTALTAHSYLHVLNRHKPPNREMCMVLFAAGDFYYNSGMCRLMKQKHDIGEDPARMEFYLSPKDLMFKLTNICRENIRKHLLALDPHTHLFDAVPKLGLPKLLTNFLLYSMSLE